MAEAYSADAGDRKEGMSLFELEMFVLKAKQAGLTSSARLSAAISMGGRVKELTLVNRNHATVGRRILT